MIQSQPFISTIFSAIEEETKVKTEMKLESEKRYAGQKRGTSINFGTILFISCKRKE